MPIKNDEREIYLLSELLDALFFAGVINDYDKVELIPKEYDVYRGAAGFDAKELRGRQRWLVSMIAPVTVRKVEKIFGASGGDFIGYRFFVNGIDKDEVQELWREVAKKRYDF